MAHRGKRTHSARLLHRHGCFPFAKQPCGTDSWNRHHKRTCRSVSFSSFIRFGSRSRQIHASEIKESIHAVQNDSKSRQILEKRRYLMRHLTKLPLLTCNSIEVSIYLYNEKNSRVHNPHKSYSGDFFYFRLQQFAA